MVDFATPLNPKKKVQSKVEHAIIGWYAELKRDVTLG